MQRRASYAPSRYRDASTTKLLNASGDTSWRETRLDDQRSANDAREAPRLRIRTERAVNQPAPNVADSTVQSNACSTPALSI
jgi:hypothetical protein